MNKYYSALYIRLSKEDDNKKEINSESIINQINMLNDYANKNNYEIYDTYIDDGYSGTNFNRPSFNRMISDIENKKINLVIVKDLSRFGRDYILTGYYLEMWFPKKNVRFISILDNYDSINSMNEYMPFKSLINDMYSKDNSKKIKAALRIKQQMGKWVGGCTPFGYIQDINDKNHLVIKKDESLIVKRIFSLYIKGFPISDIINYLYEEKIPPPSIYRSNKKSEIITKWSSTTIRTILANELYTGDLVQNRRNRINYKIKKLKKNDRKDWIIIKDTHEKIISKNDFFIVQKLLKEKNIVKSDNPKLLSGLLKCYECKKNIVYQKINNISYTICNSYKRSSKNRLCTSHSNNYLKLEERVLKTIRKLVDDIKVNRELLLLLINKIEIHSDKSIDVFFNFKKPTFITKKGAQVGSWEWDS